MNELTIYVRYSSGAYTTNRVGKLSASSTMSAHEAARRLAEKFFGPALQSVEMQGAEEKLASMWVAKADANLQAWCWRDGSIEFGPAVPADAMCIASGPDRTLRQLMPTVAPNLVVPGVREAKSESEALVTLGLWVNKLAAENGNPKRCRVTFAWWQEPHPELDAWKQRCSECAYLQVTVCGRYWHCTQGRRGRSSGLLFAADAARDPAVCGPAGKLFQAKESRA